MRPPAQPRRDDVVVTKTDDGTLVSFADGSLRFRFDPSLTLKNGDRLSFKLSMTPSFNDEDYRLCAVQSEVHVEREQDLDEYTRDLLDNYSLTATNRARERAGLPLLTLEAVRRLAERYGPNAGRRHLGLATPSPEEDPC